jgi:hypothetical protein
MCGSRGWILATVIRGTIRCGIFTTAVPPMAGLPGRGSRGFPVTFQATDMFAPKASAFLLAITSPSPLTTWDKPKPYGAKARTSGRRVRSGIATVGRPVRSALVLVQLFPQESLFSRKIYKTKSRNRPPFFRRMGGDTVEVAEAYATQPKRGHPDFDVEAQDDNRRDYSRMSPPVRSAKRSIPCSEHQSWSSPTIFSVAQGSQ